MPDEVLPGMRVQYRSTGFDVDADVAGVHRDRERLGRRQPGAEPAVDEQRPDVAERHPPGGGTVSYMRPCRSSVRAMAERVVKVTVLAIPIGAI